MGQSLSLTNAHNTAKINNVEQMNKLSHFMIYDWSSALDVEFKEGYFEGKMKSKNGYSHKRVVSYKDNEFIVKDSVASKEYYVINFHTPCEIKRQDFGLDLIYENNIIAKIITNEDFDIKKCSISRYYLKEEIVNCISIKKASSETSEIRIVLET